MRLANWYLGSTSGSFRFQVQKELRDPLTPVSFYVSKERYQTLLRMGIFCNSSESKLGTGQSRDVSFKFQMLTSNF